MPLIIPIALIVIILYIYNKNTGIVNKVFSLASIPVKIPDVDLSILNSGYIPNYPTNITKENLEFWIEFYAKKVNLDITFVKTICQTESSFGKYLVNSTDPYGGAYGAFQFLLPTAQKYAQKIFRVNYSLDDIKQKLLTDARFSSALACGYIYDLLKQYKNYEEVMFKYKGAVSQMAKDKVKSIFIKAYQELVE